ncbi:amidohydrolase family protein [Amorphus orientalis]|uniref:TIM-barrel fold metal-dependent hydrolase n=1 Tax=Amorphus orientalis TaxID=649198 RepID=A0AAE3VLS5_9HYPH|nr:amidohydrolase family protein [Amorphus orientalis]MDQ0314393.1 putative TIM-barrel fold metal-dependent hydrolase [Amorphus orientalis]
MGPHRIDVQHHLLPPAYVEAVGAEPIARMIVSGKCPVWSPGVSVEAMDRNGIATAVMSLSAPGLALADTAAVIAMARTCNDYVADMQRDYPGRFGNFATLPLPDIDASLDEIAYAFDTLGADGVCLLSSYGATYLGDPAFAPVLDELNRRKAVVHVHPTESVDANLLGLPAATLEFPFDTTRAVASLLFSGTFARCRDIRFIFSHAGGTVPFLAARMARLERRPDFKAKVPDGVIAELKRHYYDVALSANRFTFSALTELVGIDHVLYASDFPFAGEDTMAGTAAGLQTLGLDPAEISAIERDNALALMPGLQRAEAGAAAPAMGTGGRA